MVRQKWAGLRNNQILWGYGTSMIGGLGGILGTILILLASANSLPDPIMS